MSLSAGKTSRGRSRLLRGRLQPDVGPSAGGIVGVRVPGVCASCCGCRCRCPAATTTATAGGGRRCRGRRPATVGGIGRKCGGHLFAALCSRIVLAGRRRFVRRRRRKRRCCCPLVCSAVTHHLPANPPTLGALDPPLVQRRYLLVSLEISVNQLVAVFVGAVLKLRRF